jgi:hypothetical protein
MVGFPTEIRAEYDTVFDVAAPPTFGAPLTFDQGLELDFVGSGWATWSHGYSGAVYQLFEQGVSGVTGITMTLPPNTLAFYAYIQPNLKDVYQFTINSGTASAILEIDGNGGAKYVGFWTDDASSPLLSVVVDQPDGAALGLAVGGFGINGVPDAGAWQSGLAALAALAMFGWRVRR